MPSKTTAPASPSTPRSPRTRIAAAPAEKPPTAAKTTKPAQPKAPVAAAAAPTLALELSAGPALLGGPTREAMVRARAYERYQLSGCVAGHELDDWLAAEAEVDALLAEGATRRPS